MDYFKILHLDREPFSNSPDPRLFFKSNQHVGCLQKLELALRLRRGLNVVLGEVGTGKTTLCRRLIGTFEGDDEVEPHLVFDPFFGAPMDFLRTVADLFKCAPTTQDTSEWKLKEQIKHYLFRRGVEDGKTVILIIDEGQKIPLFCLEILREFLNYETNESKLLQIVIFAQTEFENTLKDLPNFGDRVNLLVRLGALSFKDARQMIVFRLDRASERGKSTIRFTYPAMGAIYRATGGYPRKIVHLCHRVILALILQNRTRADLSLVRSCIARERVGNPRRLRWALTAAGFTAVAFWLTLQYGMVSSQSLFSRFTPSAPVPVTVTKIPVPAETKGVEASSPPGKPAEKEVQVPPPPIQGQPEAAPEQPKPADAPLKGLSPVATPASSLPSEIGRIDVKPNDMLSTMVARVYGEFTVERLRKVAAANPHIANINQIAQGQAITFPVLGAEKAEQSIRGCVIRFVEAKTLEDAYRFVQGTPRPEAPMRVLPCWNEATGMSYPVVMAQLFQDVASAQAALSTLPPELSARAEILQRFSSGTMILARWR